METLGRAYYKVTYNGKDISEDISQYLLSIRYTDNTGGRVDEIQLTLENVDAFWENEWYPEKGAKLTAEIGREVMLPCGDFEIDEIEINSPADTVTIKAIAAGITTSARTKRSTAHENVSLKDVVNKIASDNGFTVEGTIGDITFTRITQNRETDLAFLRRLADKFGFYFSVRGTKLIFTQMYELLAGKSVRTIDRSDCSRYKIRDKSEKVYKKAKVYSFNSQKKETVGSSVVLSSHISQEGNTYYAFKSAGVIAGNQLLTMPSSTVSPDGSEQFSDEGMTMDAVDTGDELIITDDYVEDEAQAEAVGTAALLRANTSQQEGDLTLQGDETLVAGNNFQFTGIGKLSGKYHITTSEHNIDKEAGYEVTIQFKRVGYIEGTKGARKMPSSPGNYTVKGI